jgi:hypothetical protein
MSILISSVASLPFLKPNAFTNSNRRLRLSNCCFRHQDASLKYFPLQGPTMCPEVLIISSARPINQNSRRHLFCQITAEVPFANKTFFIPFLLMQISTK